MEVIPWGLSATSWPNILQQALLGKSQRCLGSTAVGKALGEKHWAQNSG